VGAGRAEHLIVPVVPDEAVPVIVAVPLPLSVKETEAGSAPTAESEGTGKPEAVTKNVPLLPMTKLVEVPLVIEAASFTVRVKFCTESAPTPLWAVIVNEYILPEPTAGTPLSAAVPLPLSVNVTPAGSVPEAASDGVGEPVAVTVNDPELPAVNVVFR